MPTRAELQKLKVCEIRELCVAQKLPTSGRKHSLISQLLRAYSESAGETLLKTASDSLITSTPKKMASSDNEEENPRVVQFTFRDIGDSLEKFSGENADRDVHEWLTEFEGTCANFGWNDLQKFIYGRRLLRGTAKLFVNSSSGLNDWKTLKEALETEFENKITSAEVHDQLRERKKLTEESFLQYIYQMQNIAKRGNIEEEALCEYIVRGISDDPTNKVCLYGASSIRELKVCVKQYEKMKTQMRDTMSRGPKSVRVDKEREKAKRNVKSESKPEIGEGTSGDMRCYNCGNRGHYANDCEMKAHGPKCFVCSEFGHRAKECKKERAPEVNTIDEEKMPVVEMLVNGVPLRTLFDTGSRYNLVCESVLPKIGQPRVSCAPMRFTGFGAAKTLSRGKINVNVCIEENGFSDVLFYVVPDGCMKYDAILGMEAMNYMNAEINKDGVRIRKDTSVPSYTEENEIMLILSENTRDGDIIDVAPQHTQVIQTILENYVPKKDVKSRVETRIILNDDSVVHINPRRFAPREKEVVDKTVDEWLKAGIIRESASEYASPVTLAPKKDGSFRVCVDYRQLNRKIVRDCYPMKNIEDQVDKLKGAKVFTTLDLKNSFLHVPVEASSQKYTSFVTHSGQYEFLRSPFGLCLSPASFSRFIADVFRELIKGERLVIYVDDLIIPSETEEENIATLKEVLKVAAENGIQFNWKKSQFLKREVEYVGYVISAGSYKISPAKIQAVKGFREPRNVKEIQRFIGLTSYFRKFIPGYSLIARPLTSLLKKDERFEFNELQKRSFEQLKDCLTSDPVLKIYCPGAETELHTDASKEGFGAVLLQKSEDEKFHPISYMSQQTSVAEKNYSAYHLEVLAVVRAVAKFRVYLLGLPFKIVTDCVAFKHTLKGKQLCPRVARWALLLEEYTYTVEHRSGSRMQHVDALSRAPVMLTLSDPLVEMIRRAQGQDEKIRVISELLKTQTFEDYVMSGDLLMKVVEGREVIVVPAEMQCEIIRRAHENGHFGVRKLEEVIKRDYYVPQLAMKIKRQIQCCVKCILAERKRGKHDGLLAPIPKGEVPFDTYHVDHIGPMEATEKLYKYLFVVVDSFTKYVWIYPTKRTTAQEAIQKLAQQSEYFGNPRRLVSDKGAAFTSSEFKEYCTSQNIEHVEITTGIPRGNGQVERVNQVILAMLTKLCVNDPAKWYKHIGNIQRWINANVQQSTSVSPFEAMFGVQMRHEGDVRLCELLEEIRLAQFDEQRNEIRAKARKAIEQAQEEQRHSYNLRAKVAPNYRTGDIVVIKRTQFGPGRKHAAQFLGPYKVTSVKPNNRYEVEKLSGEGPRRTSSAASHMKRYEVWSPEPQQDGRDVGVGNPDDEDEQI